MGWRLEGLGELGWVGLGGLGEVVKCVEWVWLNVLGKVGVWVG